MIECNEVKLPDTYRNERAAATKRGNEKWAAESKAKHSYLAGRIYAIDRREEWEKQHLHPRKDFYVRMWRDRLAILDANV